MLSTTMTSRAEVLQHMEGFLKSNMGTFLKSVEDSWQPADFLPDSLMSLLVGLIQVNLHKIN